MKILFLTRWFPPYGGIFIEKHAQAVALYHELTVLAILPGENSSGFQPVLVDEANQPGYMLIRCFYRPSLCKVKKIAGLINLIKFVIKSFAGYRYILRNYGSFDLHHVHILTRAALPAFLFHLLTGKPYIISEHWSRYIPENWGFTGVFRRMITRLIVRRAAAVTTVSNFLKNAMQDCRLRNKKFLIIPNIVDTTLFTKAGNREVHVKKQILHVSNLNNRSKNINGILRVIKILGEQRKDFDFVIIGGDDPYLDEAKMYASSLGLESSGVIFKGRITANELANAYRESSFLLMFSNFESFSIVIPEALTCGTPVLATAVGGIPEYFGSNDGRLISPGNEAGLLENLNFMLDHYQSFDPEYSRSFIEDRFGFKRVSNQFDELYKSIGRSTRIDEFPLDQTDIPHC